MKELDKLAFSGLSDVASLRSSYCLCFSFVWIVFCIVMLYISLDSLYCLCYRLFSVFTFSPLFSLPLCFPYLFRLHWTWNFMSNSAGDSRKADDAYPIGAFGLCSMFLVNSSWSFTFVFLCSCYIGSFIFFVACVCLFSLSSRYPWMHSFALC